MALYKRQQEPQIEGYGFEMGQRVDRRSRRRKYDLSVKE